MAAVESTMMPLGTAAPEFTLPDAISGKEINLTAHRAGRPVLVMFICNHCPFVKHLRSALAQLGQDAAAKSLAILAINSNDTAKYPDDAPDKMKLEARDAGYTFPYLFDETQQVARTYRAACTPDFFLFDKHGKLFYRGQFDDSRPKNDKPVTGADLRAAIDALTSGKPAPSKQLPSIGCNIKWKPGNEPDYFG